MINGMRAALCLVALASAAPAVAQTPNINVHVEGGINVDVNVDVTVNPKGQQWPPQQIPPLTNRCFVFGFNMPMFLPVYGLPGTPCWVQLPHGIFHGITG